MQLSSLSALLDVANKVRHHVGAGFSHPATSQTPGSVTHHRRRAALPLGPGCRLIGNPRSFLWPIPSGSFAATGEAFLGMSDAVTSVRRILTPTLVLAGAGVALTASLLVVVMATMAWGSDMRQEQRLPPGTTVAVAVGGLTEAAAKLGEEWWT